MYSTQSDQQKPSSSGTGNLSRDRRCFVTFARKPTDELVRFVVAPDNSIVPDLAERLPGRGLWLSSSRETVNTACAKRLFAKAAGSPVTVREDLADAIEEQLHKRCLDLLGMARRAGDAVGGFQKVTSLLKGRSASIILCARDGADDGRSKVVAVAKNAPVIEIFTGAELGSIFGRERTVYVAVAQKALGARILRESERLAGFRLAETV
ncbi:MAG: RNA-binding protein [Alphaproteobacteria bacterium]|nr:RNA-binding protein [Alphaproteobacteria bacterium]